MSGAQTHGYDLVMEWAEDAYQRLLSAFFDAEDFLLSTILAALGINVTVGTPFSVTVSYTPRRRRHPRCAPCRRERRHQHQHCRA